ncbi:type VII secretion protein EccCa [Cryptosporangium phraense]|uniref:Type VII secretion protein EccCa n=1 Tax=Cryptosporangium phraense TaxID=2593070 RepID=A0A545AH27_9ACTN|nr:type VII secretion protein EccCa [Cryptosporangium phraense]TQS40628.1 type VII secretion protein EccCa [Cryptosporangium phraense]
MSTTLYRRQPRQQPPEMPAGELTLQEPPVLPEKQPRNMGRMVMFLPMTLGSVVMMLAYSGRGGNPIMYAAMGLMGVGMVLMMMMQGQGSGDQKAKLRGDRRDYLRYLGQTRVKVREHALAQRAALAWNHPDPASLWSVTMSGRLWERRPAHQDFAEVRFGVGPQKLAVTITPMQTKPVEDLEPLSARALRRFIRAYTTINDQPVALSLRGFAQVLLRGDETTARGLTRALLAQMATFHSPDELRIAVCTTSMDAWDWIKWLPHSQDPAVQDAAGSIRLVADDPDVLISRLGEEFGARARYESGAMPTRDEPYVVIVLDGVVVPRESRLAGAGFQNAVVLDVSGALPIGPGRTTLRLDVTPTRVQAVRFDRVGTEIRQELGDPDTLAIPKASALARLMAPYRLGVTTEIVEPMVTNFDLGTLLNVPDVGTFEARRTWLTGLSPDRLRVPIGIAEDGRRIELDIKESAQGGMGPHGLLIGATGSGKSELLRTLVLALAMTHSSEILNLVLVDFKGGATFLGLDQLPHTSAVITNLADEASLVTRMQDALQGEMTRRQELLRRAGNYSSLLDYERARLSGVPLDPLPSLFVVVDEFSELLATHPDFAELFIMIGRLGRSLGVHLLLASQRLDEGRMHRLESHLSYRIGLRTFSAMESRSVIGVPDAYELPTAPGNGYLRADVTSLIRFKAAYVSGAYRPRTIEQQQEEISRQVVAYQAAPAEITQVPKETEPTAIVPADDHTDSILKVAVSRLIGQGPPAHRVWLPPLEAPATLDQILPALMPDDHFGLTPADWPGRGRLVVPVGIVDKPFDQLRDLLMVDLSGPGGHVGIGGGTQSGKSTLLRTLICALALTHTPREVQFYCLDFGGGSLTTLAELPHVGGVSGRMDPERVSRTIAEVKTIQQEREEKFALHGIEGMPDYRRRRAQGEFADDPFGDVFLVVDGWGLLRQDFEEIDPQIRQIAARGLAYGVHVIIAANRWSEIYSGLRDQLGTKLELKLGDAIDSMIDMRAAKTVPQIPGRGLTKDRLHYLAAVPRIDGYSTVDGLADATRMLAFDVADSWDGPPAPPVRMLPAVVEVREMPAATPGRNGSLRIPLGLGETDLQPVWHDFGELPHLTILGDTESGKTNALRLIARALIENYTPAEARVLVLDSRRGLFDSIPAEYRVGYAVSAAAAAEEGARAAATVRPRVPGSEITPERLRRRDWWTGADLWVLADDYDLLSSGSSGPLQSLVDLLPQAADIGLHVVLARAAAGSSRLSIDPVVRRLQEANTPDLALSCPPTELPLLNGSRPRQLPPGRALLVNRRGGTLLQTAMVPVSEPLVAV